MLHRRANAPQCKAALFFWKWSEFRRKLNLGEFHTHDIQNRSGIVHKFKVRILLEEFASLYTYRYTIHNWQKQKKNIFPLISRKYEYGGGITSYYYYSYRFRIFFIPSGIFFFWLPLNVQWWQRLHRIKHTFVFDIEFQCNYVTEIFSTESSPF